MPLSSGDGGAEVLPAIEAAFDLVRQQLTSKVPLFLLSAGATASSLAAPRVPAAGLLGLARSARQEAPEAALATLDIAAPRRRTVEQTVRLMSRTALAGRQAGEPEMALVDDVHRVPRLADAPQSLGGPIRMHFDARGAISEHEDRGSAARRRSADRRREASLSVRAVGLNFRDVLNVLGAYPGDPGPPGCDCAAVVARVRRRRRAPDGGGRGAGPRHRGARVGGARATRGCWRRSTSRSRSTQACTLPTTWCTVHMSLLASRPALATTLLLHAGAGGVGLAAGEYATCIGTRASATVGRPYKHCYLHKHGPLRADAQLARRRRLRARRVERCSARGCASCSTACRRTSSRARLRCCGEDGCLCEIGKRAVWSYERHESACASRYVAIALDSTMEQEPEWMTGTLQLLSARAAAHVLHGLPLQTLRAGARRCTPRSARCRRGTNTGKVVIRIPFTDPAPAHGTHLLSGGTAGLAC